ncbi:hypothetical protein [Aurantimonas sp. VKM B-3413]|uniref:hypothetical protein n=1 Tax=Aurantimonas sp. VKM B-3413 TaxID=2779401 RepID=UPI001E5748AA|nr:hypothetical protein [Aurantimonas sp. VKM B-3413]MCB8835929.1 hypothetical protein [Aurantimonas sp. VKM B-3413]
MTAFPTFGEPSAAGFVAQVLIHDTYAGTVPAKAKWAFREVLSPGAPASSSSNLGNGGGGPATDDILAVTPGAAVSATVATSCSGTDWSDGFANRKSSITIAGNALTTADTAKKGNGTTPGGAATGKYAGEAATTSDPGKGGGRLAGPKGFQTSKTGGPGSGGSWTFLGVNGLCCITYFTSYKAALAFAKSVYGGMWSP